MHSINNNLIREIEISYVYGYVYVWHDRETCLCQLKNINAHGDAEDVGHSNIHYMPIHTKLCVNMRIIGNRTPQNRSKTESSKVRVLNLFQNIWLNQHQHVISRSTCLKVTLTGFITSLQMHVAIHVAIHV